MLIYFWGFAYLFCRSAPICREINGGWFSLHTVLSSLHNQSRLRHRKSTHLACAKCKGVFFKKETNAGFSIPCRILLHCTPHMSRPGQQTRPAVTEIRNEIRDSQTSACYFTSARHQVRPARALPFTDQTGRDSCKTDEIKRAKLTVALMMKP